MQWFRFYSEALDDPKVQRLPGPLFKTWVNLLCLASKHDGALPCYEDCAFALRMDADTFTTHMLHLIECGLIDTGPDGTEPHNWQGRQKRSDNVTARVHKHREHKKQSETLPKRFSNALEKNRVEKIQNREEERITPPLTPPTPLRPAATPPDRPAKDDSLDGFDDFWRDWPKKEGKAAAVAAWKKQRPDPGERRLIRDAIPRQQAAKDWPRENWRYCPLPATWLNQRRWEDEIPDPPPKGEREMIGKDKERAEVMRRVLERRGYELAGPDAIGHPNGREISHHPLRIGDGRLPR
jgi:hypothetical protein